MQQISLDIIRKLEYAKYGIEGHTLTNTKGFHRVVFDFIQIQLGHIDTKESKILDRAILNQLEEMDIIFNTLRQITMNLKAHLQLTDDLIYKNLKEIKIHLKHFTDTAETVHQNIIQYLNLYQKSENYNEIQEEFIKAKSGLENNKILIFKQLELAESILQEIK